MSEQAKVCAFLAIRESPHLDQFLTNCQQCPKDIEHERETMDLCESYGVLFFDCKNKNLGLCNGTIPQWWHDCRGCYACNNCLVLAHKFASMKRHENK